MIGNSVKGRGFRGCLNYNLNPKKEAEVIGGNMAGQTPRELAAEFGEVWHLNQRVKNPCWHVSLSAVPGERLTPEQWNEVADRYLDQMGLDRDRHQYVVIRHHDTKHQHVHIVANRVDQDGQVNYLKWHKKDTKQATRYLEQHLDYLQPTCQPTAQQRAKLEQDYQLPDADPKRGVIQGQYWRVQREQAEDAERSPDPIQQQELQRVIDAVLPESASADDFVVRLAAHGVEMRLRLDPAGEPMGISYQVGGVALPGFALGPAYTWSGVQERLDLRQQEQLASEIFQEPVQTSLLPGVVDESERNPQRRELTTDDPGPAAERHRVEADQLDAPDQAVRGTAQSGTADGVNLTAGPDPGDRGLAALAQDFAELENLFTGLGAETDADRRVASEFEREQRWIPRGPGNDPGPAPDLGAVDPEFPRFVEPAENLDGPGESIGAAAARADGGDRRGVQPRSGGDAPVSESVQSDADVAEREAVELEDVGRDVSVDWRLSDDRGGAAPGAVLELAADASAGADQRQSEQPGNQPEEAAESVAVDREQPRLLAIAQGLSDEALVELEQEVSQFFAQAPPEPNFVQIQSQQDRLNLLLLEHQKLSTKRREKQQRVDDLGPARSPQHPFGASPQDVEAAELEVRLVQYEIGDVTRQIQTVRRSLKDWEAPVKRYEAWLNGARFPVMREAQQMLQVPAVRERLTEIHRVQRRQQGLKALQAWEAIAQKLGRPEAYLQRIREVREEYRQGVPLSDRAKEACRQDLATYQQRQRQVQRRSRGLSL